MALSTVKESLLSPTLLFDSYFLLNTSQQGGGAAREEQSLRLLLLLPTCFLQYVLYILRHHVGPYVSRSCAAHAGLWLPLWMLRFCLQCCEEEFTFYNNTEITVADKISPKNWTATIFLAKYPQRIKRLLLIFVLHDNKLNIWWFKTLVWTIKDIPPIPIFLHNKSIKD